jgi:hypothetical protein
MGISSAGDHRAIVMDKNVYMVWRYIQDGFPDGSLSIYIEAYNPCAHYKKSLNPWRILSDEFRERHELCITSKSK